MKPLPANGFDDRLSKKRDRWNQIRNNVVYLDFRSELSAFDKYIHHQSFNHWTPDATQKRYKAVIKSKWIARVFRGEQLPQRQVDNLIEPARELDGDRINAISNILGKPIDKIVVVRRKFFGPDGHTVRLHLRGEGAATYSEAHAGSGEYAVVRLVDEIKGAHKRSLILLDEPEVSLHPGAQAKLMDFIARETIHRGHQVVVSTHSPALVSSLPPVAIKVFGYDATRHRVVLVADSCSPTEAFAHLGHTTAGTQPRLIVEDELSAEIVRAALRRHSPGKTRRTEDRSILRRRRWPCPESPVVVRYRRVRKSRSIVGRWTNRPPLATWSATPSLNRIPSATILPDYRDYGRSSFTRLPQAYSPIRIMVVIQRFYVRAPREQFDHVVALADGGLNDITNLQLLCESCNRMKSHNSVMPNQRYRRWTPSEGTKS